jgi:DNA polymerase-3 subunit epsilon
LGNAINESEIEELLTSGEPEFDLDIYKLVKKALKSTKASDIVQLEHYRVSSEAHIN